MMKAMKYYLVTAKCGHVRRGFYIPVMYPVEALSRSEAAATARKIPRVKHDHHDAILDVTEVSYAEYLCQKYANQIDPYLWIHTRKEHRELLPLFAYRIKPEKKIVYAKKGAVSKRGVYHKGERIRHPKKYFRSYVELTG